ncbi:MAG: hypothetical protein ABMB14_37290 [Myxococcota bacterium]
MTERDFDADGLAVEFRWDADGDGAFEDVATYSWTAATGCWIGGSHGEAPGVTYDTAETADPDGWVVDYQYDDDQGVAYRWVGSDRDRFGHSRTTTEVYSDSALTSTSVLTWTTDAQDRVIELRQDLEVEYADGTTYQQVLSTVYTYSGCG